MFDSNCVVDLPVESPVLSPDSVRLDGSFYTANDSPTDQAPVINRNPTFGQPLSLERPFVAANTHPRIGNDMGAVPAGSQPTGILILLFTMDKLDYHFTTHGSWSGWGHRNLPAYWAGIPANGSGPCPGCKPSTLCNNCNMTPV